MDGASLNGTGIISLLQPCLFQIETQIIIYEETDHVNLTFKQPDMEVPKIDAPKNEFTVNRISDRVLILKGVNANKVLKENTLDVATLKQNVLDFEKRHTERTNYKISTITSISFSTLAILCTIVVLILIIISRKKQKKTTRPDYELPRRTPTISIIHHPNEFPTPTKTIRPPVTPPPPVPKNNPTDDFKKTRSLRRPKKLQLYR